MKNLFIIIISIVLFAATVFGIISYTRLKQERLELHSIEKRIETVKEQIAQSEGKITQLKEQNELLKQKISESENQINIYSSEISELNNKKEEVIYRLQSQRSGLANLKEELESLIKERDTLKYKADAMISRRQYANDEIVKLHETKRQLEEDIKKYIKPGKGIELEKIVIRLSKVSEGSILELNDNYGFAIIDIGSGDGIIIGDMLDVYRNDELISRVIVEKVFEDMSSVLPCEGFTDVKLMASDRVSLMR